jgi:hypothetical protein
VAPFPPREHRASLGRDEAFATLLQTPDPLGITSMNQTFRHFAEALSMEVLNS